MVGDWNVLDLAAHVCTKFAAVLDRPESLPGEKDRLEIVDLLQLGVEPDAAASLLREASSHTTFEVATMVDQVFGYLQDLQLDRRRRRAISEVDKHWRGALRFDLTDEDGPR